MTTIEALLLIVASILVGAVIALGYMFRLVLRSEAWLELNKNTMEVILRDMYGHDMEELQETLLARHPN